jgi:periplasmic divalent cation tolerance protein
MDYLTTMRFIMIYITTKDKDEALSIGHELVEMRLVACVNILDGMQSIYWWENKICQETETILIAKTRESNFEAVQNKVKQLHSYSCPCIVAVPIVNASKDYLQWLETETDLSK